MTAGEARSGRPARGLGWWSGALVAAAVTLSRPGLWAVALAGFLGRGGIVLLALPIVVLPTATGIASAISQDVVSVALGGPNPGIYRLAAIAVGGFLAWLGLGWLVGAAADVALVRAVAATGDQGRPVRPRVLPRAFVARLLAHVPLVAVLVLSVPAVIAATYHELILPGELVTPLVVRVLRAVPVHVAAIAATWVLGETIGGLAVRRIVLGGRGVGRALAEAVALIVRRPAGSLLTTLLGLAAAVALLALPLVAVGTAWGRLRFALAADAFAGTIITRTILFVALFGGALVVAGFTAALRSALWTIEASRAEPATAGSAVSVDPPGLPNPGLP